jgi:hypothetical protein
MIFKSLLFQPVNELTYILNLHGGSRGHDHDHMVVGFITTYATCAYRH